MAANGGALLRARNAQTLGVLFLVLLGWHAAPVLAAPPPSCPNAELRENTSAARLPDCRAYEQVSPPEKDGFAAYPTQSTPVQLSASGNALAYQNLAAFPGAVGNTALFAAHVSTRTADGWQTAEWTPEIPSVAILRSYKVVYAFSRDLSQAIVQVPAIPLTPEATPHASNLFLRNREGAYSLVNNATPTISVEEACGPKLLSICWAYTDVSTYAGASTDFTHVVFESNAQLTPEAPLTGTESLYEGSNGHVRLVGILPDNTPAVSSTAGAGVTILYAGSAQEVDRSVERAVSQDGSHVVFQAPADGGEPDPEQIGQTEVYDRIDNANTIELSAPASEATPAVSTAEPATFQTASVDGSRVFFTTSAELTTQSNTGTANNGEDLYEYNLKTRQLTDLSLDDNPEDAATGAMVQGVVDSSSDGAYIYFVANGQLSEGKGIDGQPNLYMVHDGERPVFIATLSSSGSCDFTASESSDSCVWSPFPVVREAYVTPDGKHIAFMSTRSLSTVNFPGGYNNMDQETGKADSEVYIYTSPGRAGGTGQLMCGSCDPTGAQPVGNALIGGISPSGGLQEGRATLSGISTPSFRVRSLSEDGRRLFYAAPALLTTPYNSVYEYEQAGEGSCTAARGCQYLISDPNISEADYFLGTDPAGNDAFLATSSRLTSTDLDNVRDVYDARVNGGIPHLTTESSCESQCRQTSPTEADTPLSTGFPVSSGNHHPTPIPIKINKSIKAPPRAKSLTGALIACRKHYRQKARRVCERRAVHHYRRTR